MNEDGFLSACQTCGLVQRCVIAARGWRNCCVRCGDGLRGHRGRERMRRWTVAAASSALLLYPVAIGLPLLRIERLGVHHEANAMQAGISLFSHGDVAVGAVVLGCSVVLPLVKLLALLDLAWRGHKRSNRYRVVVARAIEWTGRWSMVDVLAVAVLAAAVKLGDLASVTAGSGAVAFTAMVALSLIAGACFDPRCLWEKSVDEKALS